MLGLKLQMQLLKKHDRYYNQEIANNINVKNDSQSQSAESDPKSLVCSQNSRSTWLPQGFLDSATKVFYMGKIWGCKFI